LTFASPVSSAATGIIARMEERRSAVKIKAEIIFFIKILLVLKIHKAP
jgi:hypothetical protein